MKGISAQGLWQPVRPPVSPLKGLHTAINMTIGVSIVTYFTVGFLIIIIVYWAPKPYILTIHP